MAVALALLIAGVTVYYYLIQKPLPETATETEKPKGLGSELYEKTSNPLQDKLKVEAPPETNPFKDVPTNPFKDVYRNPFE